jgi:peptidoglycan/LPS O-acetylase OafA/YrhL
VLTWSWRPGASKRAFYRRRFARIAPAYWVALVYGLIWVVLLYRDPAKAAIDAIPAVFGLQAWFPDPAVHFAADGVEWSVSAELFFYVSFPLLIWFAHRRGGLRALLFVAVILGAVVPVLLASTGSSLSTWAGDVFPVVRLGEFICGILLALAIRSGRRSPVGPRVAIVLFIVCYAVLPLAPSWVPSRGIFLASILLVIAALAQADLGGRGTWLGSRVPVRLGEWSYCFYLVHQMTLQIMLFVCSRVVPGRVLGPVWFIAALAASIALSAALYTVVERPFERRLRAAVTVSAPVA